MLPGCVTARRALVPVEALGAERIPGGSEQAQHGDGDTATPTLYGLHTAWWMCGRHRRVCHATYDSERPRREAITVQEANRLALTTNLPCRRRSR